jgi:RAB protein geranylgeranyltransferase component A
VSDAHEVAPKGHYIVLVSTFVETNSPKDEVKAGLALLGPVLHQFWSVDPVYAPANDSKKEGMRCSVREFTENC